MSDRKLLLLHAGTSDFVLNTRQSHAASTPLCPMLPAWAQLHKLGSWDSEQTAPGTHGGFTGSREMETEKLEAAKGK